MGKKNYAFFSSFLGSCKCSSKEKIHFLEKYSKEIQIELVILEDQHIFPYQYHSFGISSQQQRKAILLPSIIESGEFSILDNEFEIENRSEKFNHDYPDIQYLEGHQIDHHFYDPVVDHMEGFFSLNFQPFFHCGYKLHHEFPSPLYYPVLILLKHSKEGTVFKKLLDWLHWNFCVI